MDIHSERCRHIDHFDKTDHIARRSRQANERDISRRPNTHRTYSSKEVQRKVPGLEDDCVSSYMNWSTRVF